VTEYPEHGTLKMFLSYDVIIEPDFLRSACAQAASALLHLEELGYIHCNVKASSFSVYAGKVVKLRDVSRAARPDTYSEGVPAFHDFAPQWAAPELLLQGRHTHESDAWSLGVLIWEVYARGQSPWPSISRHDVTAMVIREVLLELPPAMPVEVGEILTNDKNGLWVTDPGKRMRFSDVKKLFGG
jgi:serine/threonine protein kinase